ncbi:MAG: type III secretion chaperone SycN [Desulfovibrionaceae bacterium]|nr:type III secretion chaperone SycN [Desulfovibrionaceae bacterium]
MQEHALAEFGRRMGLTHFSLAPNGCAALTIDQLGRLELQLHEREREKELLLALVKPAPAYDADLPRRVLAACCYDKGHILPLHGGVYAGNVVFSTRLPERELTAANLERAVLFLETAQQECEV